MAPHHLTDPEHFAARENLKLEAYIMDKNAEALYETLNDMKLFK